jgi:superfamily II helicase
MIGQLGLVMGYVYNIGFVKSVAKDKIGQLFKIKYSNMNENYKDKNIDISRYSVVNINDNRMSEEEMKEKGYVFVPYICVEHTEESLKSYNDFMSNYHEEHKCCPKCGSEEHMATLCGYVLNMGEEYKNKNICEFMRCGDKHLTHDRVSLSNIFII